MVRLLLVLCCCVALHAVEAQLSLPDPVIPGALMTGELIVRDAPSPLAAVQLPSIPGIELQVQQGGRNETRIVNGVQSSTRAIPIAIRVASEGPFVIPAFTVTMRDGSTLQVPATTGRAAPGEANLTGDLVAAARFVPDHIVPGEAASLVYDIWLKRGEIPSLGIDPPSESLALGERTLVQSKAFDAQGQEWAKVTVTWPITFPASGTFRMSGQQEIRIFDNRATVRRVGVASASITVAELPTTGKPEDFTGLVGDTAITSRLDRSAIAAGEGARFEVTVRTRQADLVRRPALTLPPGVTLYPVDNGPEDPVGTRTFRWDVVPAAPGSVVIPAVAVPWFDPVTKAYRRAEAPAQTLTVRPGRARELGLVGQGPTPVVSHEATNRHPVLPEPLRLARSDAPRLRWALGAGGVGIFLGIAFGVWRRRAPRTVHRGKALATALRAGDVAGMSAALAAMRPALTTAEQQNAADALSVALEAHRFGGQPLPDLRAWQLTLEAVA